MRDTQAGWQFWTLQTKKMVWVIYSTHTDLYHPSNFHTQAGPWFHHRLQWSHALLQLDLVFPPRGTHGRSDIRETDRYAEQCLTAANSRTRWTTSVEELKAYLGFMIVMGINRLPRDSRLLVHWRQAVQHVHCVKNHAWPLRRDIPLPALCQQHQPTFTESPPSSEGSPHHHTH